MTHLFRHDDLESRCPSCRTEHSKSFTPEFCKHQHYKTTICSCCGYKISIATKEHHSGHY